MRQPHPTESQGIPEINFPRYEVVSVEADKPSGPRVAMDIELGRDLGLQLGEVLNIDEDIIHKTLRELNAPEDNSELTIIFGANHPGDEADGYYDPDTKEATIGITDENYAGAQETLEHELQHYVDDLHGRLEMGRIHGLLYNLSFGHNSFLLKGALTLGAFFLSYNSGSYVFDAEITDIRESHGQFIEYMDMAVSSSYPAVLGALALASVYWIDPAERRAYRAQDRIKLAPAISKDSN